MKYCLGCKKDKQKFHKSNLTKDGLKTYCAECENKRGREYRKNNKELVSKQGRARYKRCRDIITSNRIKRKFGITLKEYNILLKKQNYTCAICKKTHKMKRRLYIDHDHKTGKTRGILCIKCNLGLGSFVDNIKNLYQAIKYLRKYRRK